MTLSELIRKTLDTVVAGTDPDSNILQKLQLEAETLCDQALNDLARSVAGNSELRARLTDKFTVALTNGEADLPDGLLLEYMREGSVRDGVGNALQRVRHFNDFNNYLPNVYGYYCIEGNKIHTKAITTSSLTSTASPITLNAPFVPTKLDMSGTIPDELEDDLVRILADKIRGIVVK